eukprot:403342884
MEIQHLQRHPHKKDQRSHQSIPEIGRIFYQMNRVRTEFKGKESQLQAQYEIAVGINDKEYYINKYMSELNIQDIQQQRVLEDLEFKREVEADGNIFVGLYKDGGRFYGRYYQKDYIKECHLRNGEFNGEACGYRMHLWGNHYYDGEFVDGLCNGYGVQIFSIGNMHCSQWKNGIAIDMDWAHYMNGIRHGEGVWTYPNGDKLVGAWVSDEKHGEYIKTYANGKQEKIIYLDDEEKSREEIKTT